MILTPDNEYTVVLDACVLVPMPLCDTLLRCGEEPALFRVAWSAETLREVDRTLFSKFKRTREQVDRRLRNMREAFPEASVSFPETLLLALPGIPDAEDRHVVAAAIHSQAHAIVTANIKHFPQAVLDEHNILVQTPDRFLVNQYHLNPDRMLDILDTQAAAISKHRSRVLELLEKGLPEFVALMRDR